MLRILGVIMTISALTGSGIVCAQSATQRIHGDVVAVDGASLQVRSLDGENLTVKLTDDVRLTGVSRADATAIKSGGFVGTTAIPQPDGTLKAVEVHVFPESMRGTGEGHYPVDSLPGGTMTNATVASDSGVRRASRNTMTNATVASVAAADQSRKLTLQYKGGEKVVTLGADVPVVMLEPADRSLLATGAHVILITSRQTDGSLAANRVLIGKNGTVPPM